MRDRDAGVGRAGDRRGNAGHDLEGKPGGNELSASSPPRPKTNGSPPLRRTTRFPFFASATSSALIWSCGRVCALDRLPTWMTSVPAGTIAAISRDTSASMAMRSASAINSAARRVRSPGSPGPAPTR